MSIAARLAIGLLIASSGCSQAFTNTATNPGCPPPRTTVAGPSTPTLAAGGRGVGPREVTPTIDEGETTSPSTSRLASGGRGVPARVDTSSPQAVTTPATPRLAAGGRGVGARVECE